MTITEDITGSWTAMMSYGAVVPWTSWGHSAGEEGISTSDRTISKKWIIVFINLENNAMSHPVVDLYFPEIAEIFWPRTSLGRRLLAIRRKAIQAGMKLLTEDRVLEEVRRRREEREEDEADLY